METVKYESVMWKRGPAPAETIVFGEEFSKTLHGRVKTRAGDARGGGGVCTITLDDHKGPNSQVVTPFFSVIKRSDLSGNERTLLGEDAEL